MSFSFKSEVVHPKKKGTDKWIIEKLEHHDKLIRDMMEMLKDIRQELTEMSNQTFVIDFAQDLDAENKEDSSDSQLDVP